MITKKHADKEITDPLRDQQSLAKLDNEAAIDQEASAAQVTSQDKKLLKDSFDPSYDINLPIDAISLDERDNDGTLLNEKSISGDLFGRDLDDDLTKEEDEENGD
jgi:hypothetical protein